MSSPLWRRWLSARAVVGLVHAADQEARPAKTQRHVTWNELSARLIRRSGDREKW